jgi:hypothetical protein
MRAGIISKSLVADVSACPSAGRACGLWRQRRALTDITVSLDTVGAMPMILA